MENRVLKTALLGYSKRGVEARFTELESEFSKNLNTYKHESDAAIAELTERVAVLEAENETLRGENAQFRTERDNVMAIMLDAQEYAETLRNTVNEEAEAQRAENAALAEAESARIDRYRQRISAIRDELFSVLSELSSEMEGVAEEFSDTEAKFDAGDALNPVSLVNLQPGDADDDILSA